MNILSLIKIILDYIAVIIMVWGVLVAVLKFIKTEFKIKDENLQILEREKIRAYLATYILIGLEIFIVGDIIAIIVNPTQEELFALVIIVVVRTIMSYFLEKDFKSALDDIKGFKSKA